MSGQLKTKRDAISCPFSAKLGHWTFCFLSHRVVIILCIRCSKRLEGFVFVWSIVLYLHTRFYGCTAMCSVGCKLCIGYPSVVGVWQWVYIFIWRTVIMYRIKNRISESASAWVANWLVHSTLMANVDGSDPAVGTPSYPAVEMGPWLLQELGKEMWSGVMMVISPIQFSIMLAGQGTCGPLHHKHLGASMALKSYHYPLKTNRVLRLVISCYIFFTVELLPLHKWYTSQTPTPS